MFIETSAKAGPVAVNSTQTYTERHGRQIQTQSESERQTPAHRELVTLADVYMMPYEGTEVVKTRVSLSMFFSLRAPQTACHTLCQ